VCAREILPFFSPYFRKKLLFLPATYSSITNKSLPLSGQVHTNIQAGCYKNSISLYTSLSFIGFGYYVSLNSQRRDFQCS
jgi:hypothetical protein